MVESLEQRLLLSTSLTGAEKTQILSGLTALDDVVPYLNTAGGLGSSVNVLGEGMGAAFDVSELFSSQIIASSSTYFNGTGSPTLEAWAASVQAGLGGSLSNLSFSNGAGIHSFTFDLSQQRSIHTWQVNLATLVDDAGLADLGLTVAGNLPVAINSTLAGTITMGVSDANGFFITPGSMTLSMGFGSGASLSMDMGMFTLRTGSISGSGVSVGVSLTDPDSSGRIYTSELVASKASIVGASVTSSSATVHVPVEMKPLAGITVDPFTVAPEFTLSVANFVASSTPTMAVSHMDTLVAATALTPQALAMGFLQLATNFGGAQGLSILQTNLPFTRAKVGDLLKLGLAISDGVNPNILTVAANGVVTPLFDTISEFKDALGVVGNLIHINPNTRTLTIDCDVTYDFDDMSVPLDFSAGVDGLSLSTTSTLTLGGSLGMQFRLGVQIAPGEQLAILPVGQGAATETHAAGILNGRLGSSAHFGVYVDGTNYTVTVPSGSTSTNSNLLDLVADINAALATAGLGGTVEAYLVNYTTIGGEVHAADFSNPAYDGTGVIGLRTVGTNRFALRVDVAGGDIAHTQLGYPDSMSVKPQLAGYYVENASVDGELTLSADNVTATAKLGIVALSVSGSASVTGSVSGALVNPGGGTRITFAQFATLAASKSWPDMLDLDYTGSGSVLFDSVQVVGIGGLSLGANPQIEISFADITQPRELTVTMDGLGNLSSLGDISVAQILTMLSQGTTFLSQMQGLSFLQYKLPIINESVAGILDVASRWAATIQQAQSAGGQSLQIFSGNLSSLFAAQGLPDYSLSLDGTSLKFTLEYSVSVDRSMAFNMDLKSLLSLASGSTALFNKLTDLVDANGTAKVDVGAQATATIALGLDLSDPAHPRTFVYDESGLSIGVRAAASDMNFQFSFGPLSAYIKGGSAALDGDGDAGTVDYATFAVTIDDADSDGRHYFDDVANPLTADLTADVTAAAGLSLPVYFPTDSMPIGGAGHNFITISIANLKDAINGVPGSVDITAPNFNNLFTGYNIIQVLSNPAAVLDGLKAQFNMVTGSLSAVMSAAKLPLVGDQFVSSIGFIQDIGDSVLQNVRTKLNEAMDGGTPTELLQLALYNALHSVLQDTNGNGVDQQDVLLTIDPDLQSIQYDMTIGGTLFDLPVSFGGLDILPLSLSGTLNERMDWSWSFGFGLDVTDGFYVVTSAQPELSLTLGVSMPDNLHGSLFFLNADAVSMDDGGESPQPDRQILSGQFLVDLVDPSGDGRLTLSEMRQSSVSNLIHAGFTGGLHADLQLMLSIGGSDVFPRFRTTAALDWSLTTTFGAPTEVQDLTVNFTSVELNLGSVINGFLKPVCSKIDDIVSPIMPVLDFLDTDLPIINASPLDIASAFGYGQYAGFISTVRWVGTLAHTVASTPGTDFWLNMGSFSVTNRAGTRVGGTITAHPVDFGSGLASSDADANTKALLSTAVSGNTYFRLNILDPSTIFGLLMGQDVSLLTFSIPDLSVSASYSQYFPIFGPLGMRIGGELSAKLHIGFGYDTYGIREAQETGNWTYLLDGFYVTNRENADGTGAVVPTVTFGLGLTASAECNLGIARGGVSGGLHGQMDLTLVDPNDDGKIRMTELWYEIIDPRKLFDIHIIVTASVSWYLELGISPFSVSFGDTIWSGTIYEDTFRAPRDRVIAKPATDGQLVVNVGRFAEDALSGNTTDGNDTVGIRASGGNLLITVGGLEQSVPYTPGDSILLDMGDGDDTVTIDSSVNADIIFKGGAGHDVIHMGGTGNLEADGGDGNDEIYYTGSGTATLVGGTGDDRIEGGSGDNYIDGGDGDDTLIGGTGNNTYLFADGFGSDLLSSLGDINVMDFSAITAPLTLDLTDKQATDQAGNSALMGFTPSMAIGGSATDMIRGRDQANTWTITGADQGDYNAQMGFASFEQLVGGNQRDQFVLQDGAWISGLIEGGTGAENAPDADYADQVNGDVVDLSDYTTSNRIQVTSLNGGRLYLAGANPEFSGIENFSGGSGRDYLVLSNDQYIVGKFSGNGGLDRMEVSDYQLTGVYKRNEWILTDVNSGALNRRTAFDSVENYSGGQTEDTFYIYPSGMYQEGFLHGPAGNGGAFNGTIDGEGRTDTISGSPTALSNFEMPTQQALQALGAEGGDDSVQYLGAGVGGMTADGRIDYTAYDVVWEITGHNSGRRIDSLGSVDFQNLQNIDGSPQKELFIVLPGGSLDGFIDGEGGSDALVYGWDSTDFTNSVQVSFHSANEASATNFGGYVRNIETFIGGTNANNSFGGPNQVTNWVITGEDRGSMGSSPVVTFTDFQNIAGGTAADHFTFQPMGVLSGGLNGGSGTDLMDLSGMITPVTTVVTGPNYGSTSWGLRLMGFGDIESISTGSAGDAFAFSGPDALLSGTIDGGSGNDVVTFYTNEDRAVQVTGVNSARIARQDVTMTLAGIENIATGDGNDTFLFAQGARVSGLLNGAAGSNTFDYSQWNVTSPVSVNLEAGTASGTGAFANIGTFIGSQSSANHMTARDTENLWTIDGIDDGTVEATVAGGTHRFYNFQNLTGGTADDTFTFANMQYVHGPIQGMGGDDMLDFAGYSLDQNWTISSENAGRLLMTQTLDPLPLDFTGIENIQTGDAINRVTFADDATLVSLQGGSGIDTLDLSAYTTSVVIDVNESTMTPIESFGGFERITGSAASDTVIGENKPVAWFVYGDNRMYYDASVSANGDEFEVDSYAIDFRSIENLVGGTGEDGFWFDNAAGIDGSLEGGDSGLNAAAWMNYTTEVQVNLEDQTATGIGTTWNNINLFVGGNGVDTLIGSDDTNLWEIQQPDSGQINAGETTFASFGNLAGGDDNDVFSFDDGASVSGTIDGAGGTNILDWTDYGTAVSVNLQSHTATGMDGFASIDQFQGGDAEDTLIGPNEATTWALLDVDAGFVGTQNTTVTFTSFENLTGGSSDDTFQMQPDTAVSGAITGGGGRDVVDYSSRDTAISFNIATGQATDMGGFAGIEELVGSTSDADQLTGPDISSAWNMSADYAGSINEAFDYSGIEQIVGGTLDDHFYVGRNVADMGTIDGGDGDDNVVFSYRDAGVSIELTGNNEGTVDKLGSFTNVENIGGSQYDDTITFDDGATLDGFVDGQDGTDTLDYSAYTTPVAVDLQQQTATGLDGFSWIEQFKAGTSGEDSITGLGVDITWIISDTDTVAIGNSVAFTGFGSINGGDGDDTFVFLAGGSLSGSLDGGDGSNALDYSGFDDAVTVSLADGTATGIGGTFANINSFTADDTQDNTFIGTDNDSLWSITDDNSGTVNVAAVGNIGFSAPVAFVNFGTLVGGAGVDRFVFSDGVVVSGSLDGGDGLDSIDLTAYTTINTWTSTADGVQIRTDFGTFSYTSIENFRGNMSVFLFTHADLSATWGEFSLPSQIVPGETFVLPVQVKNLSNVFLTNRVDVTLYASTDGLLDDGDIELGSLTKKISLKQDQQVSYSVSATFPVGMDFGSYYLIAKVDALQTIVEANEDNNTAVSEGTWDMAAIFGKLPGRNANVPLSMPADDGGYQVYTITGPGWGRINDDGSVELFDTTAQSQARVVATGDVVLPTLPEVTIHGTVGAFRAPNIHVTGDVTVAGGIGVLTLGDVGGAGPRQVGNRRIEQLYITIGQSTLASQITLGEVNDLSLTTNSPVASLSVSSWTDNDQMSQSPVFGEEVQIADSVHAGPIGQLLVDGDMMAGVIASNIGTFHVGGDLIGNVTADNLNTLVVDGDVLSSVDVGAGLNPQANFALLTPPVSNVSQLKIGGQLGEFSTITITGSLANATVGGDLAGLLDVGGNVARLAVGGDVTGRADVGGNLTAMSAGTLAGHVSVQGGVTTLVVDGELSGEVFAFRDLKNVRIAGGDLSGKVGTNQALRNLQIVSSNGVGGALSGRVEAGDRIVRMSTTAASTGLIQSPQIFMLNLGGGFDGTLNAGTWLGIPKLKRGKYGLGRVVINGDLAGTVKVDAVGALIINGDMAADVTVNGGVARKPIVGSIKVTGDATDSLWQINGDVGSVNILGQAHGLDMISTGSVKTFNANSAQGLLVSAGLANTALDNDVVVRAEVTNAAAILGNVRIGPAKLTAGMTVSTEVTLAAPHMGKVLANQVNDLGKDNGSVLWLNDSKSIKSLASKSTDSGKRFIFNGKTGPTWPALDEPMKFIEVI